MAKYKYTIRVLGENRAKAVGRALPVSTKQAIEVCNFIKNMPLEKAKAFLGRVVEKKIAVPARKIRKASHKKGIGPGRYPIKASKEILGLLNEVEANAQHKGLSGELKIAIICANKSSTSWHFGRKRRRKTKRTNIEIVVEEVKKKEIKQKKAGKKSGKKPEQGESKKTEEEKPAEKLEEK